MSFFIRQSQRNNVWQQKHPSLQFTHIQITQIIMKEPSIIYSDSILSLIAATWLDFFYVGFYVNAVVNFSEVFGRSRRWHPGSPLCTGNVLALR